MLISKLMKTAFVMLLVLPLCLNAQNVFPDSGYVGIGTRMPAAPLDVTYTGFDERSVILGRLSEGSSLGYGTYLGVQTGWGTNNNRAFRFEHGFYGNANGAINFYHGSSEQNGSMYFLINAALDAMYIDSTGYVGIGTNSPQSLLAVNGTITAQRITVKDASLWPDYVFEKRYRLVPLARLQQYVQDNRHLPEMPAASTMERDGLEIAAAQKLLLKKIEELTLYLIDVSKESNRLQKENTDLQRELTVLEHQRRP